MCHSWRDTFISRPSFWVRLDFANVDKTRTYIQRSQSSPLDLLLGYNRVTDDAFGPVITHVHRLKSLTVNTHSLSSVLRHFRRYTPLLEKLDIQINTPLNPVLDSALFSGDLSSLRELRLDGVITRLLWKNLTNLRLVNLQTYCNTYDTTQILDFFESAPLLHTVFLQYWAQSSTDAPPERTVPLRHLQVLTVDADPPHPTLLRHLYIPIGAPLILKFHMFGEDSLLLDYIRESSRNLADQAGTSTCLLTWNTVGFSPCTCLTAKSSTLAAIPFRQSRG